MVLKERIQNEYMFLKAATMAAFCMSTFTKTSFCYFSTEEKMNILQVIKEGM